MQIDAYETRLLRYPLDGPIGGSGVTGVDVLVVWLTDQDGRTGLGISYTLGAVGARTIAAAAEELLEALSGRVELATPEHAFDALVGLLNRIGKGAHYLALAAIDMALWDLHAKRLGCSLGAAMGGHSRPVPVYGSGGFRPRMDAGEAVQQALEYAEQGCRAVKLRLTAEQRDARFLEGVRRGLPDDIALMVDVNEKGSLEKALWVADVCRVQQVLWLEEPLRARDYEGYRHLAERSSMAIAAGEHLQGQEEIQPFLASRALAVVQPDHSMMGGLTECLRVARRCAGLGVAVAPHFLPSLFVHLASALDSVTWLEDFPLLEPLFLQPQTFDTDGFIVMPDLDGHGLCLDPDALARYGL